MATEHPIRVPRVGRDASGGDAPAIRDLLAHLGATVEEVAANLLSEGCLGWPYNDCFCPVANYLSLHTDQAASATTTVSAVGDFTRAEDGTILTFIGREWTRTPAPVAELIAAFDDGEYPALRKG